METQVTKSDELLQFLTETIKSTVDFTKEQAPEVARQMLEYGAFKSQLWLSVSCVGLLICIVIAILYKRKLSKAERYHDQECYKFAMLALGIVPALMFIAAITHNTSDLMKIKLAPKIYLIEKITGKEL